MQNVDIDRTLVLSCAFSISLAPVIWSYRQRKFVFYRCYSYVVGIHSSRALYCLWLMPSTLLRNLLNYDKNKTTKFYKVILEMNVFVQEKTIMTFNFDDGIITR